MSQSVFKAYEEVAVPEDDKTSDETWLKNASFQIQLPKPQEPECSNNKRKLLEEQIEVPVKAKKFDEKDPKVAKKSSKNDVFCIDIKPTQEFSNKKTNKDSFDNDNFYIDKKPTREFLTVKTISRPCVAKYKIRYYFEKRKRKNIKFQRYFDRSAIKVLNSENVKECDMRVPSESSILGENSSNLKFSNHEEEVSRLTAFYNKNLYDNPNSFEMWLKFIDFQDVVFKFEKSFKKGSLSKRLQLNAERKLTILEKAIHHNPNSEDLHRKRLHIMVNVYPADELQKRLKELLDKDQGNIILWQGFIEATQCSMSHCNTTSVLRMYINCLSNFHKMRRMAITNNRVLEENILRILYQCGLFLKQSGLFEQLWTLLKLYLEMNLGQEIQENFNISVNTNERQLLELEDMVFKSQLPSHELWLRIEKLRESCHWLPATEQCEDPQRIVFTDDVVELIQPITMPENTFKLIATVLTLLKIPLLPCRSTTMQELGLDYVPWALDSIESILPIFYPIYPINLELNNISIDYQLAVGPQYLKVLPGQEEYLSFILKVMEKSIDCLNGKDKSALTIWWFRFQRLLIILENNGKFKIPPNVKKNIKSNIKSFLKKSENRSNILFYIEYALIEKEINCLDSCIKILEVALSFLKLPNPLTSKANEEQRNGCYLIRIIAETMIHENQNEQALKYLVNFALGKTLQAECELIENVLTEASLRYKHVTLQLLSQTDLEQSGPTGNFLPIFLCDWIVCNGWLIFLTKGPLECGTFLEDIIEKLSENSFHKSVESEIIFEFYVGVMFKFSMSSPGYGLFKCLDDVIFRALQNFPNNSFILSAMAKEQLLWNSLGPKWWKIKNLILKMGHALPILMLISIMYQIILNLQDQMEDTITGDKLDIENTTFKYSMLSLFKAATKPTMCTKRCGLIWRLYLQFVHKYFDPKLCRKVYYCAVEECPWLKALYIDAAIYIPAELGKIQDLIIEKELRIHITPEELEVLRD